MKKKLLVLLMLTMSFTFIATGCGEKEEARSSRQASEEIVEEADGEENTNEELEEAAEATDEITDEVSDEISEKVTDDTDKSADKVYTKERVASAFLFNDVEMTISSTNEQVTVINSGSNVLISSTNEEEKMQMDIYFVDLTAYIHTVSKDEDVWMKSTKMQDTIQEMVDGIANANITDNLENVEYIETVTENGVTYDVVNATELRDDKEFQKLTLYINVDTGYIERSENDTDGEHITILYKPSDGFELPKEAENATEI